MDGQNRLKQMDEAGTTELLERARRGDTDAFAGLFEAARPTVQAVAYRLVGPSEAEDVVMETYLKAWKALPGYNGRGSLRTWLCRIAHNCAVDWIRARRHIAEPEGAGIEAAGSGVDDLPDPRQRTPAELVAAAETGALIQAALGQLGPEHRTTLLLRFSDGLSYSDIAASTGVSIGTVMSRIFNGRRQLMKRIRELGGKEQ